jgi:hypothetical protein
MSVGIRLHTSLMAMNSSYELLNRRPRSFTFTMAHIILMGDRSGLCGPIEKVKASADDRCSPPVSRSIVLLPLEVWSNESTAEIGEHLILLQQLQI